MRLRLADRNAEDYSGAEDRAKGPRIELSHVDLRCPFSREPWSECASKANPDSV
jgi:hypothetical protein